MADNSAVKVTHGSVGTTAETSSLTRKWNKVTVKNKHATQTLGVRVFSSDESNAAAVALADATDAVEAADENFYVHPAGGEQVVFVSSGARYVALSVVGSGATTTYVVWGETYTSDT